MGLLQVIWPSKVRDFQRGEMCVTKRSKNMQSALGSLRIDDFGTTMPLDCVTGFILRMLIWALASVAPKSTPLLTAIRWRPRKSRT